MKDCASCISRIGGGDLADSAPAQPLDLDRCAEAPARARVPEAQLPHVVVPRRIHARLASADGCHEEEAAARPRAGNGQRLCEAGRWDVIATRKCQERECTVGTWVGATVGRVCVCVCEAGRWGSA